MNSCPLCGLAVKTGELECASCGSPLPRDAGSTNEPSSLPAEQAPAVGEVVARRASISSAPNRPPRPGRNSSAPSGRSGRPPDVGEREIIEAPSNDARPVTTPPEAKADAQSAPEPSAEAATVERFGGDFQPDFSRKRTIVGMPIAPAPGAATSGRPSTGDGPAAPHGSPRPVSNYAPPANAQPTLGGPAVRAQEAHAVRVSQRTMVGVPVPHIPSPGESSPPVPGGAAASPSPSNGPVHNKTVVGIAAPGVSPVGPGVSKPSARAAAHSGQASFSAPRQGAYYAPSDRPPPGASAPRSDRPSAPPARSAPSQSAAIAVVAGLVLAAGAAIFALLWRSPVPLRAEARVDANGSDVLHITCATCADGTELRSSGNIARIAGGSADLQLASPLRVGDNRFTVDINRPGAATDEQVSVVVKIGYRIRPDLSQLDADQPTLRVAIDGVRGAVITMDGKQLALGTEGQGVYDVDITADCTGLSDEPKVVDRAISYAMTSASGAVENGTINMHVAVPPLHIDTPAQRMYIEAEQFLLAGRTSKGARLTANGQIVGVATDGSFSRVFPAPRLGSNTVTLRTYVPGQASRIATLNVERVEHLSAVVPAFTARATLAYPELAAAPGNHIGEPVALTGEVVEARTQGSRSVVVFDVQRGCSHAPCLARVLLPGQEAPLRGSRLQVFGHVKGAVSGADAGASVPEIEAAFTLKGP